MNLLKGPIDDKRMGRTNCNWSLSTDPEDWSPDHDCPNQATHHIRWDDNTMSQVCGEHLNRIAQRMREPESGITFVAHKFREQCSKQGSVWLMPANICTDPNNNGSVTT